MYMHFYNISWGFYWGLAERSSVLPLFPQQNKHLTPLLGALGVLSDPVHGPESHAPSESGWTQGCRMRGKDTLLLTLKVKSGG